MFVVLVVLSIFSMPSRMEHFPEWVPQKEVVNFLVNDLSNDDIILHASVKTMLLNTIQVNRTITNLAIRELMINLNEREIKQYDTSRKALFDKLDKPALKPLPKQRYLYTETKRVKVGPDCHIEYRRHYYSVPINLLAIMLSWEPPIA